MAEFAQTMKNWHRLCQAMTDKNPKDACDGCQLEAYGCSPVYEALDSYRDVDFEVVGETIVSWAAEHPEPVYPTWIDWLMSESVIPTNYMAANSTDSGVRAGMFYVTSKAFQPIPADIAQKLGIEPKEG